MGILNCLFKGTCKKYILGKCDINSIEYCIKESTLTNLYNFSNIPKIYLEDSPLIAYSEEDKKSYSSLVDIENNIESFVKSGDNLYLYSKNTGNGKTSWAIRLLKDYLKSIWYKCDIKCHGLYLPVSKYFLYLKDSFKNKNDYIENIKDELTDVELIVWDDIFNKTLTSYEAEVLLSILDDRISNNLSNIFTANTDSNIDNARLSSRISGCSYHIEFIDSDKRGIIVE